MAFPKKTPNGGKGVPIPKNAPMGETASGHAKGAGKWHGKEATRQPKGKQVC